MKILIDSFSLSPISRRFIKFLPKGLANYKSDELHIASSIPSAVCEFYLVVIICMREREPNVAAVAESRWRIHDAC